MSFCKKCGNPVNEEKFCKHCRHNLVEEQATPSAANSQPTYEFIEKVKEHKKPLSIGGAILAVLIITFAIIGQFFSPDRTVNQFDEALQKGGAERVAELMSFSTDQEVATEDAKGFVKYLNDNPDDYQDLHSSLQDQVTVLNGGEDVPSNFEEAA
ncbi:TcaA second domain-containing protein [Alkalibacillus sp. S2W]|uniref:TcaA second domain-containing protein n=1 Tax=Alkalibacillus sp. S2W TaxID=3386553 RepID=UPI00398D55E5